MIFDKEAEILNGVGFDLETMQPGPGNPLKVWAGVIGDIIEITMGTTKAEAEGGLIPCITVNSNMNITFELPSNTQRWIATISEIDGLFIILPGFQTNT